MIQISGLRKSFGGKPVLEGVDLVVKQGESLCVIGQSGRARAACCAP